MVSFISLLLASCVLWYWWDAPADISAAKEPIDGHFVYRGNRGEILQETIWRNGKLISAWETVEPSHWMNGYLILEPARWEKVVRDGTGCITDFNKNGRNEGTEWYIHGDFDRGAH